MNHRMSTFWQVMSLLIALSCDIAAEGKNNSILFIEQQIIVHVEIANNQSQREYGLMHRTHLAQNQGMLFSYPDQALRRMWMKNTLLPLDVLFLDDEKRIVSLLENLQPCRHAPCPIYTSRVPARYMLELNANFINRHQITIGQALDFSD